MSTVIQFFAYAHLPPHLSAISAKFADLAHEFLRYEPAYRADCDRCDCHDRAITLRDELVEHLPPNPQLQRMIEKFGYVTDALVEAYETDELLQYLLEAKDCAVRALLYKRPNTTCEIIVNGRSYAVPQGRVFYEHVVQLLGMAGNPSMVVRAPGQEGRIVCATQFFEPVDGMVISCHYTGNS